MIQNKEVKQTSVNGDVLQLKCKYGKRIQILTNNTHDIVGCNVTRYNDRITWNSSHPNETLASLLRCRCDNTIECNIHFETTNTSTCNTTLNNFEIRYECVELKKRHKRQVTVPQTPPTTTTATPNAYTHHLIVGLTVGGIMILAAVVIVVCVMLYQTKLHRKMVACQREDSMSSIDGSESYVNQDRFGYQCDHVECGPECMFQFQQEVPPINNAYIPQTRPAPAYNPQNHGYTPNYTTPGYSQTYTPHNPYVRRIRPPSSVITRSSTVIGNRFNHNFQQHSTPFSPPPRVQSQQPGLTQVIAPISTTNTIAHRMADMTSRRGDYPTEHQSMSRILDDIKRKRQNRLQEIIQNNRRSGEDMRFKYRHRSPKMRETRF